MSDPDSTDLPPSWLRQVEELLNRLRRVEEYVQEMVERQREKQEKLQDEQEALADVRAKPVKVKDVAKVQELLAAGSEVNERDKSQETPLIKAALAGQAAVAAALSSSDTAFAPRPDAYPAPAAARTRPPRRSGEQLTEPGEDDRGSAGDGADEVAGADVTVLGCHVASGKNIC